MPLSPELQAQADKEIEDTIQTERDAAKEGGYTLPPAAEKANRTYARHALPRLQVCVAKTGVERV